MTTRTSAAVWLSTSALLAACAEADAPTAPEERPPAVAPALRSGPPALAVMGFGADVGSPFPPTAGHDGSYHASDRIRPNAVVISAGGTVTFEVGPAHQVAVYDDGVSPEAIEVSPATLEPAPELGIPDFVINDADGRIGLGPALSFFGGHVWSFTFEKPGRYLVICTIAPHFLGSKMYGWVIVK
jgi:plastocyanin